MRKVLFKRFIPSLYVSNYSGVEYSRQMPDSKKKEGTGIWEEEFKHEGLFHCWGYQSTDSGESVATDTIAIIEMPDGTVENVFPSNIKFIK